MSKPKVKRIIKPELFEVTIEHGTYYVVAYDTVHAITLLVEKWGTEKDIKSVKKLTDDVWKPLFVAKECLPQGLVNKIVDGNTTDDK